MLIEKTDTMHTFLE